MEAMMATTLFSLLMVTVDGDGVGEDDAGADDDDADGADGLLAHIAITVIITIGGIRSITAIVVHIIL